MSKSTALWLAIVIGLPANGAENSLVWPRFRGPNGSGVAIDVFSGDAGLRVDQQRLLSVGTPARHIQGKARAAARFDVEGVIWIWFGSGHWISHARVQFCGGLCALTRCKVNLDFAA